MSRRVNLADMLDGEPLEEATEAPPKSDVHLPLAEITDNPENPRGEIDESDDEFRSLVESISEIGVTSPISVCNAEAFLRHHPEHRAVIADAKYVLLAGHRRVHAARIAKRTDVPGFIDDAGARDPLLWALAENGLRQNLNPIQQAEALYRLTEKPPIGKGLSQAKVAKAIGRTQPYISQMLLLRKLVPELQELVVTGVLGVKDARAFARMPTEDQVDAYQRSLEPPTPPEPVTPALAVAPSVPEDEHAHSSDMAMATLAAYRSVQQRPGTQGTHGEAPIYNPVMGQDDSATYNPVMSEGVMRSSASVGEWADSGAATGTAAQSPRAEEFEQCGEDEQGEPYDDVAAEVPAQRERRGAALTMADWHDIPAFAKAILEVLDREESQALAEALIDALDE
ncbi:ParB/RepB/Spo0J family partition protein [Streptantibioticus cattleyicolor]|uniref:ParB-like partition protein n=1 Tax=Streptantibioticus cattleyicolor (strain ATCC 35852 / DSM 46488 / JCM 4925 / NBRC 14057 / NRRL 8057) TaxID=1003195 RepID=F8JNN4_STREN|nr:ParB/RepB/Spo0J family partition protein [Streptantibioticus cattleyicolor]AEW98995.1 parB-like partition protein [Streptantibioticus cattleyicolor NRRL 8057 = DSM 46488]CCB71958.1 protein of unknown function [Streptantibioticus cattleyicolor NRRL 8057 = DSM 46488]